MKKLIIILGLLVSLFFLGIERLNYLSQKEIKLDNFSTFNKVEIYTAYILMNVLGYPLYPEISKEAMLMLDPSVRNKEIHFESHKIHLNKRTSFHSKIEYDLKNSNLSNLVLGIEYENPGLVFGIALIESNELDWFKLIKENTTVKVVVPCSWPKWSNYKDKTYTTPLSVFPEIKVQEGLFWILEQEGWIHPYTAIWKTSI